ncbi:hypothetical protein [Spiroplasma chrysopicola]|uniref:Uncharacterized protein n=1 Tax=Spiroplasma chrysopicola DF-1 TaxID=1276227 RepID=R4UFF6_9MOLU|nr:hypothetical protein [Spiroplasma chrysopicola]AGM24880.1 hypothetical protein SCHRY_v1c02950 [Spiroplasma chrysopicola DF-1]
MDRNNRRQNNNFDGSDWDAFTSNNQYRGNGYYRSRQNPNRPNNPNFANQQRQPRNNNQPFPGSGPGQDYLQTCMCKNCTTKRHPVIKTFVIIFVILAILGGVAGALYAYSPKIRDWIVNNIKLPVNSSYKMMSADTFQNNPLVVKEGISKEGQTEWKTFAYGQLTVFYQTAIKQQLVEKYNAAPSDVEKSFSLLSLGLLDQQQNWTELPNFESLEESKLANDDEIKGTMVVKLSKSAEQNIDSDKYIKISADIEIK